MSERLPVQYDRTAGTIAFQSGTYKGKSLVIWDAVTDCDGEDCPAFRRCPFEIKHHPPDEIVKCSVQLKYVKSLAQLMLRKYVDKLTERQLWDFGMHVMPLASHLVKLKLIESSLGLNGIFQPSKRGLQTHPVYREIRETIKAINFACQSARIDPGALECKKVGVQRMGIDEENEIFDVDTDYYERMSRTPEEHKRLESPAIKEEDEDIYSEE